MGGAGDPDVVMGGGLSGATELLFRANVCAPNALRFSGSEWKCIFAEHTSPHIKTPIFPLQGEYE